MLTEEYTILAMCKEDTSWSLNRTYEIWIDTLSPVVESNVFAIDSYCGSCFDELLISYSVSSSL